MLRKYIPKSSVNVSGKMSEQDAGITAKMYAAAAIIAALSLLVSAIGFWFR